MKLHFMTKHYIKENGICWLKGKTFKIMILLIILLADEEKIYNVIETNLFKIKAYRMRETLLVN